MAIDKNWSMIRIKNMIDVSSYIEEPTYDFRYETWTKDGQILESKKKESSVKAACIGGNTFSRYAHPKFKPIHYKVKNILEDILKEKLYPTYFFDRFYYNGSYMRSHIDRPSCEISVTLNISHNLDFDYPIHFSIGGQRESIVTNPGDGVIYKGIEFYHWRRRLKGDDNSYFHQLFLHYVRADGHYLEYAYDTGKTDS